MDKYDEEGNAFARLALLEEIKLMPYGDIWNYYCETSNVPTDRQLIGEVMKYEKDVLIGRG